MEQFLNQDRPRRREYSQQFKAEILALSETRGYAVAFVKAIESISLSPSTASSTVI